MTLTVDAELTRGNFALVASLSVAPGETLALLGPNGSGKTSVLEVIAGLLSPTAGRVVVNGRTLTETEPRARVESRTGNRGSRRTAPLSVPVPQRRVSLLGQDSLLFPHLSVRENVAFGLRARGITGRDALARARHWLDSVGLSGFEDRMPSSLSGGQQQRVAIARALAAEPEVLLLDEPMAALDVQNASLIRTLLRDTIAAGSFTTIVVTHDVVDAMVLADSVAILDHGRVVDRGPVARVLSQPANRFAADLVGLNFVTGVLGDDGLVQLSDGRRLRGHDALGRAAGWGVDAMSAGDTVTAVFAPDAVSVSTGSKPVDHNFGWQATVGALEPAVRGIRVPFTGDSVVAELTAAQLLDCNVHEGSVVTVSVDPDRVTVYPTRETTATPR